MSADPPSSSSASKLEADHSKLDKEKAISNLPWSEVDYVCNLLHLGKPMTWAKGDYRRMITLNRIDKKICNACESEKDTKKLQFCTACHCTWYCNEECRKKDEAIHSKWCCKEDATPDTGPMKTVLVPVSQERRYTYQNPHDI